jgi:hypothetical protein
MPYSYNLGNVSSGQRGIIKVSPADYGQWFTPTGADSAANGFISKYSANLIPIMFNRNVTVTGWGLFVDDNLNAMDWPGGGSVNRISFKGFVYDADSNNRPANYVGEFNPIDVAPVDEGGPGFSSTFMANSTSDNFVMEANKLYWVGAAALPEYFDGETQVYVDTEIFDFLHWPMYTSGDNPFTSSIPVTDGDVAFMNYGPNGYYVQSIVDALSSASSYPSTVGEWQVDLFPTSAPIAVWLRTENA